MTKPYCGAYSRRFSNYAANDGQSANYTVNASSANPTMGTVGVLKLESSVFDNGTAQQSEPLRGGALSYPAGTKVRIVAKPQDGCEFVNWTGDYPAGKATQPTIEVVLSKNVVLVANFKKTVAPGGENVTLNVRWDGAKGRVSGTGNFSLGSGTPANSGSVSGTRGNTVRLTASPLDGYRFVRWEGVQLAGNTQRNTSPTIDIALRNATITAIFEATETTGGTTGASNGQIDSSMSDHNQGTPSAIAEDDTTGKILAFVKKWWWAILIAAYLYYDSRKGGSK